MWVVELMMRRGRASGLDARQAHASHSFPILFSVLFPLHILTRTHLPCRTPASCLPAEGGPRERRRGQAATLGLRGMRWKTTWLLLPPRLLLRATMRLCRCIGKARDDGVDVVMALAGVMERVKNERRVPLL